MPVFISIFVISYNSFLRGRPLRLLNCVYLSITLICLSISGIVESQTLWSKSRNVYIKVVETEYNNDHPVNLRTELILPLMTSLAINGRHSDDSNTLFDQEQLRVIAGLLPEAFASLNANQEIVFVVDRKEKGLAMLGSRESFVAGRLFFSNGALNIILGDIDKPRDYAYEAVYDPTRQGLVSYDFNHGERVRAQHTSKLSLTLDEDYAFVAKTLSPRWLSIDKDAFTQQFSNIEQGKARGIDNQSFVTRDELKAIIETNKQTQQQVPSYTEQVNNPPATPKSTSVSLEARFKTLNKLKEQGLITEQEYQSKRQELLAEL